MKNTSRIHRNGGKKSSVPQGTITTDKPSAKRRKPDQDAEFAMPKGESRGECYPTCLCLYDRKARVLIAKIPLAENESAELILSHGRAGTDFKNFIADAIREKLSKADNTSKVLPSPMTDVENALENFESAGRAAVALCVLNATMIQEWIKGHGGAEKFDLAGVMDGMKELAGVVATQFAEQCQLYRAQTMEIVTQGTSVTICSIENAVSAVVHLLDSQSYFFSACQSDSSAYGCVGELVKRLKTAWNHSWDVRKTFRRSEGGAR